MGEKGGLVGGGRMGGWGKDVGKMGEGGVLWRRRRWRL